MTENPQHQNHGIDAETDDDHAPSSPSLDDFMRSVDRQLDGWIGVNTDAAALAKQRQEQTDAAKRQANDFRDCFATEAGRKVLEHMFDMTLRARPYPAGAQLPMDVITPIVIAHDAQCNFVWAIVEAIALAENRTATPRSTT